MQRNSVLITIVLFMYFVNRVLTIELDEDNFDKLINKFEASLIKFDISFPFGDKHKAFKAFAKESMDEKDLLIADVLVKDHLYKYNEALARKYGAPKDKLPVVKLFLKGKSEPISFDGKGFTSDELRRFVREKSGLYLSLPGCIQEFDNLAVKFMKSKNVVGKREKILKNTEEVLKSMGTPSSGNIYKTVMEKILELGDDFIQSDLERVKKLLSGNVSDGAKKQLETRFNILQVFQSYQEKANITKQDL